MPPSPVSCHSVIRQICVTMKHLAWQLACCRLPVAVTVVVTVSQVTLQTRGHDGEDEKILALRALRSGGGTNSKQYYLSLPKRMLSSLRKQQGMGSCVAPRRCGAGASLQRLHSGNTRSLPQLPPILSSLMESQRAPTPAPQSGPAVQDGFPPHSG